MDLNLLENAQMYCFRGIIGKERRNEAKREQTTRYSNKYCIEEENIEISPCEVQLGE